MTTAKKKAVAPKRKTVYLEVYLSPYDATDIDDISYCTNKKDLDTDAAFAIAVDMPASVERPAPRIIGTVKV